MSAGLEKLAKERERGLTSFSFVLDSRFRGNDKRQFLCRELGDDGGGVEAEEHKEVKVAEVVVVVTECVVGIDDAETAGGGNQGGNQD